MSNNQRVMPIGQLPNAVRIEEAVEAACNDDISFIEERLRRGTSVLVECEKELSLYLYLAVRARLRRQKDSPKLVVVDGRPRPDDPPGSNLSRMLAQLTDAIRGSVERTIIVLLHLDVLTTTHTGLTLEARESIPLLYENPEAVLLGFRDPSFEIPRVIQGVFAAKREIIGTPRDALPKIVTQREAKSMHNTDFDPYGLYKYVSGLNPVRCRKLFSDLALRREASPGRPAHQEIYQEIRKQTVSEDIELPNVDLDKDIGGYGEVKSRLREELIDLTRRKENLENSADIEVLESLLPRGVIFHGPPGTGKTYFAKAMATALNASVLVVSGPELKSKWVGESEENLRRVFRQARQAAPSVIIFDEIDSFAHQRGSYVGSGVEHSMVNQLLTEMDGFRKNEMVFIVATTNFLESLDGALMRPGRFEFMIEIPAPSAEDRGAIIRIYNERFNLQLTEPLIQHMVRRTEGMADREKGIPFAGDHIQAVCRALKRQAIRTGSTAFTSDDIDKALQRKTRRPVNLSAHEEKVVAVHEAGHALSAILLPRATPPERISIVADMEGALGYVMRQARARPYAMTEEDMRAEVCVGLAGMAAEKMVFGEFSIGAWNDLQQANSIVRALVDQYGMSKLGVRVFLEDEDGPKGRTVSPVRLQARDEEIDRMLREEMQRCEQLLRDNRALHDALVSLLLERKVLDASSIAGFVKTQREEPSGANLPSEPMEPREPTERTASETPTGSQTNT
ncbi:MAG: AAA family ATPase [Deltaproteobacteria bacterium]|nr:AAA family ATPase [Deltaproteobacteria bacterium]